MTRHASTAAPREAPALPADFGGGEFGDALHSVFSSLPLQTVFRTREVCREWRRSIDGCSANSRFWRTLACQQTAGQVPRTEAAPLADGNWKAVARKLAQSPLPDFQKRLLQSKDPAFQKPFTNAEVKKMLETLSIMGELAVVDCQQTPLSSFFTQELKSVTSLAIYMACSQKPADASFAGRGLQRSVYGWWRHEAGRLAARIRKRMTGATPAAQALAQERLAAFIKLMVSVALPYVDRSYVRTFCTSTLRVLSVKEIGEHALAAAAPGPPPPMPQDDVVLDDTGGVDEEALLALTTSRLLEAELTSLQHYANLQGGGPF
jgi:hypothetical protein